ncbi:MAG: ComEC/Rec2 family competence protein [Beutenbergiaceae bacterium]
MTQDLRLVPAAALTWLLVWFALLSRTDAALIGLLVVLTALLGCTVLLCRPLPARHRAPEAGRWAATAVLALALAVAVSGLAVLRSAQRGATVEPWIGARVSAVLQIRAEPRLIAEPADQQQASIVAAVWLAAAGGQLPVRVPVVVMVREDWSAIPVGSTVQAQVEVVRTPPGDSAGALLIASGFAEQRAPPPPVANTVALIRAGLVSASAHLNPQGRALVPGIAIGDDRALQPSLAQDMRAVNLTHLTAVSGAHVAMVVGLVLAGLVWAPRPVRAGAATLVLAGLVALVHPEASVLRAAAMGLVLILGLLLARPRAALPALWFTVIALLALDPWLARSYGFALSVSATAGLLLLARPLAQRWSRFIPAPLASMLAVPVAAQLACAPVLVLLQPDLPVHGVLANVLAAPAVPPATLLGLLAALLSPAAPQAAHTVATMASWFTAWIATAASWCAALPLVKLPWSGGLVAGALGLLLAQLRRRARRSTPLPRESG